MCVCMSLLLFATLSLTQQLTTCKQFFFKLTNQVYPSISSAFQRHFSPPITLHFLNSAIFFLSPCCRMFFSLFCQLPPNFVIPFLTVPFGLHVSHRHLFLFWHQLSHSGSFVRFVINCFGYRTKLISSLFCCFLSFDERFSCANFVNFVIDKFRLYQKRHNLDFFSSIVSNCVEILNLQVNPPFFCRVFVHVCRAIHQTHPKWRLWTSKVMQPVPTCRPVRLRMLHFCCVGQRPIDIRGHQNVPAVAIMV